MSAVVLLNQETKEKLECVSLMKYFSHEVTSEVDPKAFFDSKLLNDENLNEKQKTLIKKEKVYLHSLFKSICYKQSDKERMEYLNKKENEILTVAEDKTFFTGDNSFSLSKRKLSEIENETECLITHEKLTIVHGTKISGLLSADYKVIFLRDSVTNLFKLLTEFLSDHRIFLIKGPPGCGKSTCLLNFFMKLKPSKVHMWVHFEVDQLPVCIIMNNEGEIETCSSSIDKVVKLIDSYQPALLVLDGIRCNFEPHINVIQIAGTLRKLTGTKLIYVTSIGYKIPSANFDYYELNMNPWNMDEYLQACSIPEFFSKVFNMFENVSENATKKQIDEAVRNKFFYVGGSARWMFQISTQTAIATIDNHISRCSSFEDLISSNVGATSSSYVHHLSCEIDGKRFISSEYILNRIAKKFTLKSIRSAYAVARKSNERAHLGWVVQADYIHLIEDAFVNTQNISHTVYDSENKFTGSDETWIVGKVIEYTGDDKFEFIKADEINNLWLIPKFKQPCFDLVHLFKNGDHTIARFVNVTCAEIHSLDTSYIYLFLQKLISKGLYIDSVEFVFMSPINEKVTKIGYFINSISDWDGWSREKVRYLKFDNSL